MPPSSLDQQWTEPPPSALPVMTPIAAAPLPPSVVYYYVPTPSDVALQNLAHSMTLEQEERRARIDQNYRDIQADYQRDQDQTTADQLQQGLIKYNLSR